MRKPINELDDRDRISPKRCEQPYFSLPFFLKRSGPLLAHQPLKKIYTQHYWGLHAFAFDKQSILLLDK